ncbi:hypothetical protein [Aeromicrobium sp.]|uniref:hypothetical protein n=1 Tax=Aeromicrobium sp. TaxID=1871063 RepID=UPI003D6B7296
MLIVRYHLASGESGEDVLVDDDKWSFGRPGTEEPPTVSTDDRRISRGALVIRDSGPGPVVYRGQRGEVARVGLIAEDGSTTWLSEAKAGLLTDDARRIEFHLGEEHVITVEVDFADRGSVKERRLQALAEAEEAEEAAKAEKAEEADSGPDTL